MSHKHLTVPPDTRQLKTIRDAVLELAGACIPVHAHMVALAVDEAVSNVMRHGQAEAVPQSSLTADSDSGDGVGSGPAIDVDIDTDGMRFEVLIADAGPAYNPCTAVAEDAAERTKARKRGGMGLSIMRRVMDEIHYGRTSDDRNQLRMVKYVTAPVAAVPAH